MRSANGAWLPSSENFRSCTRFMYIRVSAARLRLMAGFYYRFLESVARWPRHIAIELQRQHGDIERLTYSELRSQAESVGSWLEQQSGPNAFQGARCAILADNGPRWVAAYLGTLAAGGVAVPLDTAFSPVQVSKLLKDSGSTFLFADSRHLEAAREAVPDARSSGLATRLVLLDSSSDPATPGWEQVLAQGSGSFKPAEVSTEDLAVLLYTSGTTSDPKGVMLSHGNLVFEVDSVAKLVSYTERDAILGILPL